MNLVPNVAAIVEARGALASVMRAAWFYARVLAFTSLGWAVSMAVLVKLYCSFELVRTIAKVLLQL